VTLLAIAGSGACSHTTSYPKNTGANAAPASSVSDQAVLLGKDLILTTRNDQCLLSAEPNISSATLALKPPCHFMRTTTGELEQHTYQGIGVDAVVIIVGNPISDAKRAKWGLNDKQVCGEKRQALLVLDSTPEISDKVLEGGVSCVDSGSDEKDFWYFAH
jgi:hypothetical protein